MKSLARMILTLILFLFAMVLTNCSKKSPVNVDYSSIRNYPRGTLVLIAGFLKLPPSTSYNAETKSYPILLKDPASNLEMKIFIQQLPYGKISAPNSMKSLPLHYSSSDLLVWSEKSEPLGNGDKVLITGWMGIDKNGTPYINPVTKVEKNH
jgi:hypothetical protein